MLCFQAKACAMAVELSPFATHFAVQEVPTVELNARLGRQHFQHSSTRGFEDLGGNLQPTFIGPFQDPVVVVPLPKLQLLVALIDSRPDGSRLREIKGAAADRPQFSCRYQRRIDRRKLQSAEKQLMLQNFLARYAGQIEITMIG